MSSKQKQKNKSQAKSSVAVAWSNEAWDDYIGWLDLDVTTLRKINDLIEECKRTPFSGTGKPEPLKGDLSGFWSRRINQEHRLVYLFEGGTLFIAQCKYHY
jgi:toxin YoeB